MNFARNNQFFMNISSYNNGVIGARCIDIKIEFRTELKFYLGVHSIKHFS